MSIGRPTHHESAHGHVTGSACYVDDRPEPRDLLHGMVLGSPHAHARILGRDATAARALPGVHAVLFAADLPAHNEVGPVLHDEPLLATDEVHCVGQAVAVVYAESREQCRAALAAMEVEYEALPAILDIEEAVDSGSFMGTPHEMRRGDADAALASAPHRLAGTYRSGAQNHFYLETQAALAIPGEDHTMVVWSGTQHPSETQALVAEALGWGRHRVEVISPRMGGAFGGKETQANHWAVLAGVGAFLTGRAVKVVLDRDQDMTLTGNRHPAFTRYEAGFDDEGRLLAYKAELYVDGGWATDLSMAILDRALYHADNAYFIPHVLLYGQVARTNTLSNCAFRGFGGPQGMMVMEQLMDRIGHELGLDPLAVRMANLYGPAPRNLTPYHQEVSDPRNLELVPELVQRSRYHQRVAEAAQFNDSSPWVKRAVALTPIKFGISFTVTHLNQAGAFVVLYSDGTAQLNHGGTEMGQGLYTKMLQVCAHGLGIEPERIRPMYTSTDKVPNTSATAASSGSDLNGQAVRAACQTLVERLRPVAARLLGAPVHVVQTLADDQRDNCPETARDGHPAWAWVAVGEGVSFEAVVAAAYLDRVSLSATGFYRTPGIWYDRENGRGKPFYYYVYGAAVSEVELNGLTGEWKLRRVDILHDVGESLSPDLDRGQIEGGFVQGMGWLTMEEFRFDDQGRVLTHSPSTYKIPAIGDVPEDFRVDCLARAAQPGVIHGSKAVGEPPFMLAISVHRALARAASAFGGWVELPAPATTEALLTAVRSVRGP